MIQVTTLDRFATKYDAATLARWEEGYPVYMCPDCGSAKVTTGFGSSSDKECSECGLVDSWTSFAVYKKTQ